MQIDGRPLPRRLARHVARLGHDDPQRYLAWCQERGFSLDLRKDWQQLEREWIVHSRAVARAQARLRVDRDPAKLIALVCSGERRAQDLARPRWRQLAGRIEGTQLCDAQRAALRTLVEAASRRGSLLLAEARFGNQTYSLIDGIIGLARVHTRWLRAPREWRPRSHNAERQFTSLARHLLARYDVPGFLDAAWLRDDPAAGRYRDWFLAIGTGRSIRHETRPIVLTRKIAHHLMRAPASYSIEQALRWGQIHALGGDRLLCDAVVATRLGDGFENEAFWVTVLRFFVAHPTLDRSQIGPIVDFLQAARFERRNEFVRAGVREEVGPREPNLCMRGRSPQSLLRAVEAWHRELARAGASAPSSRWPSSGIGSFELEVGVVGRTRRVWRIRELLSSLELRHEGAVMRHCVASYAGSCTAGRCSIWALELHGFESVEKRQTVQVDRNGVIVQCRGRFNRLPRPQELDILRRWAEAEGLVIGTGIRTQ